MCSFGWYEKRTLNGVKLRRCWNWFMWLGRCRNPSSYRCWCPPTGLLKLAGANCESPLFTAPPNWWWYWFRRKLWFWKFRCLLYGRCWKLFRKFRLSPCGPLLNAKKSEDSAVSCWSELILKTKRENNALVYNVSLLFILVNIRFTCDICSVLGAVKDRFRFDLGACLFVCCI